MHVYRTPAGTSFAISLGNANAAFKRFSYRVRAINSAGVAGPPSNVARVGGNPPDDVTVPGAPTGLSATALDATQISRSWTAPAMTGGAAITAYKIQVSTDGGSTYTDLLGNTGSTTPAYTHTDLMAGTTYYYTVAAINSAGTGALSALASATAAAPTVSSVTLTSDPDDDGRTGDDATYAIGDTVKAAVAFSADVTVTGAPQLTLDIGVSSNACG